MSATIMSRPLKIIAIGNSQGVRLPKALLRRFSMSGQITVEERPDGLLLRGALASKASLKQTFTEMAQEQAEGYEDWRDLDVVVADGLKDVKW